MSIQPGLYRIKNAKSETYFDASVQDPGVIHGWANRPGNKNQTWFVQPSGQGYVIKNGETGAFAGVGRLDNGTPVEAGGRATEWHVEPKGNDTYRIVVAGSEQAIDLDMGRSNNGASIHIWHWTGAEQQHWRFEEERGGGGGGGGGGYEGGGGGGGGGYQADAEQSYRGAIPPGRYCIENAFSGTAADLAGGGTNDGTPITGWSANRGANQAWELVPGRNGYKIRSVGAGTWLSFQGNGDEGTMICGHSSNAVEWQITQADQGYQIHLASNPNIVLDLAGGGKADGVKICLYSNHNGSNQQWKFENPS